MQDQHSGVGFQCSMCGYLFNRRSMKHSCNASEQDMEYVIQSTGEFGEVARQMLVEFIKDKKEGKKKRTRERNRKEQGHKQKKTEKNKSINEKHKDNEKGDKDTCEKDRSDLANEKEKGKVKQKSTGKKES